MHFHKVGLFCVALTALTATLACGSDDAGLNADATIVANLQPSLSHGVLEASTSERNAAEMARLALHRSRDENVLAAARTSLANHEAQYVWLRRLAHGRGLQVTTQMDTLGQRAWTDLFNLGSKSFDAAYKTVHKRMAQHARGRLQRLLMADIDDELRVWITTTEALWAEEIEAKSR